MSNPSFEINGSHGHPHEYKINGTKVTHDDFERRFQLMTGSQFVLSENFTGTIEAEYKEFEPNMSIDQPDNWIKCSERLPELDKPVLGFIPSRVYKGSIHKIHLTKDGYWEDSQYDAFDYAISDVTHWQPLPEPPRE